MVKGVKFRRGTTVEHSSFTGAEGEITIDTDKDIAVVHDGTTVGGKELVGVAATQAITNKTLISATNVSATNVSATNATVSGVTTFTNGPVLIGTGTSTGTVDQDFQVVGGGYISGNLGIGTTNPKGILHSYGTVGASEVEVLGYPVNTLIEVEDGNPYSIAFRRTDLGYDVASYLSNDGIFKIDAGGGGSSYSLVGISSNSHKFYINSSEVIGIDSSGLDVRGDLGVTGLSTSRNLTVVGVTTSSTINDSKGDVRAIPQNPQTGAYILAASDAGKHIDITTGGVTVNASIFSVGDVVTVYNDSGSSQTITQGSNVTLRLAATATTGTRTLAQYGICTLLCVTGGANPVFIISGAGLT